MTQIILISHRNNQELLTQMLKHQSSLQEKSVKMLFFAKIPGKFLLSFSARVHCSHIKHLVEMFIFIHIYFRFH